MISKDIIINWDFNCIGGGQIKWTKQPEKHMWIYRLAYSGGKKNKKDKHNINFGIADKIRIENMIKRTYSGYKFTTV